MRLEEFKGRQQKVLTAFLAALQMAEGSCHGGYTLPPPCEMYKLSQFVLDTFMACDAQPAFGGWPCQIYA